MKKIVFLFLTVFTIQITNAQDYQYTWAHSLLDSILPNGVLVSDITTPVKAINETPRAAVLDNSSNVVFTGNMNGQYVDLSVSSPEIVYEAKNVIFIQKRNPDGEIVWSNYIDQGDHDVSAERVARHIAIDSQDNIFICGYTIYDTTDFDPGPGEALLVPDSSYVGFIAKYTKEGNFSFVYPIQGNGNINPYKIAVDDNDNVLVTGTFRHDFDFDGGVGVQRDTSFNTFEDNFLLKIDNTGQYVWHKTWGCTNQDYSNCIVTDEAGNSYVACAFKDSIDTDPGTGTNILESNTLFDNSYVSKFDASGNFVWSTLFKSDSLLIPSGMAYNAGKIAMTGSYKDPIEIIQGSKNHAIPEVTSEPNDNLFVVGLDTSGKYLWDYTPQSTIKSDISSSGHAISANNEGWFLSMWASDSSDFDNTSGVDTVLSSGYGAVYVLGLSEIGQYQLNKKFEYTEKGSTFDLWYVDIWNNDLCVFGQYEDAPVDVNPDPVEIDLLPKQYSSTSFLVKLTDVTKIPTIIGFSPESGPVGTSVTISGTNFDTEPANNTVYFGAVQATVTSSSWSQLTATVPAGATYEPITVSVNGLSVESAKPFTVTVAGDNVVDANMFNGGQLVDAGSEANKTVQGDLDKDGFSDLVVASGIDSTLSIYRNISEVGGEITFESKVDFALAGQPADVTLSDIYGNGYLDVVVSYTDYPGVSVFRNNGDGGFSKTKAAGTISLGTRKDFTLPGFSTSIATGDLNGDGKFDLAAVDSVNNIVRIFINTGIDADSVNFNLVNSIATGNGPVSVAIADIDKDLYPDLVIANSTDQSISVIRNNRLYTFEDKQDFALTSKPWNIVVGDLDDNGKVDIAVSCMTTPDDPSSMVRIFANNSTPENISLTNFDITGLNPESVAMNDINNDGKTDLVCSNSTEGIYLIKNTSNGSLSFDPIVTIVPEDVDPYAVSCGDMNNDSEPEVILPGKSKTTAKGRVEILKNLGSGNDILSFSFAEQLAPATIDTANHTIDIDLVDCTDPTALVATFTLSPGATAAIAGSFGSTPITSGVTSWNYYSPVPFLVTSETNDNQIWIVTVHANKYAENVTVFEEACESYLFDGNILTATGQYQATFTNQMGCDSVVTLNLNILQSDSIVQYNSACESFDFEGNTLTASGQYQANYTNQFGCDSVIILNLTINHPDTSKIDISACDSYLFDGNLLTTSGQYIANFEDDMGGCDSVVVLSLTITHSDSVTVDVSACESYMFDGNTLTSSGQYQATFTNQHGCDSMVTLNLTILEPSTGTDVISVCESYTWINGVTYTQSNNTATYTLTNSVGCDSVVTLNLTILEPSTGTDVISSCDSYKWIDGITYTESNDTTTFVLTNSVGCDSVVTLNLTILEQSYSYDTVVVCNNYEWNGNAYTASGDYQSVFTNAVGCDSTAMLNLTIADTCAVTLISEVTDNNGIRFYPNPVHDHLVVELPSTGFSKIEILDITGKVVLIKLIEGKEAVIENLNFETGTYILRIVGKDQSVNTFLLMKN